MTDVFRLFLIEDDDGLALLIVKTLERAGHGVTRCRSAVDALLVLGHRAFDLVLLDYHLPDMAGLDLLAALAREGIATPALIMTGSGDEQLATRVLHAGALDYIVQDAELTFLTELPKRVHESVTRYRLQTSNRLLLSALESARDGILVTDLQGTILHVNHALERMTGYTRGELCGQTPRLLKSGIHPPELFRDLWQTVLARGSWQGELTNRRKDGSLVEISLTVSPIVDATGRLTHFVGIQRDITDRKLLERQLVQAQKMQSLGTLAGGVAHEFNNLLAGVNGYAALALREPDVAAPVRQFLHYIVDLSERAAALTRQMLAFARQPTLRRTPTRLVDLVHSTLALLSRTMGTEVQFELPADNATDLLALADANQLQQALVNLLLNARDALAEPTPVIVRLYPQVLESEEPAFPANVPPGDYAVIEVVDRGCGMSAEVLTQALDPFFTTKEVGQGTGLGLPVVFGLIQGHQGYLTLTSSPGRGTCARIHLPRLIEAEVTSPDRVGFEVGQVVEPEQVPGRHIVVVDDEQAVLDVVRRFLEIAGHQVSCAANGTEARVLLSNGQPVDLVILDLMMPQEDGASILRYLRQRRPHLPVLLCTGLLEPTPPRSSSKPGRCNCCPSHFG